MAPHTAIKPKGENHLSNVNQTFICLNKKIITDSGKKGKINNHAYFYFIFKPYKKLN